jgi:hypothetical protein
VLARKTPDFFPSSSALEKIEFAVTQHGAQLRHEESIGESMALLYDLPDRTGSRQP